MFQRRITEIDVRLILEDGQVIEEYPGEHPYPGRLIFGLVDGRPIHVVALVDSATGRAIVITVYEPNPLFWQPGFKRRRI
jgi:hypothetical protein